ncbi:MAG: adenosine deaminase [Thermomicrobiaceae bacterium]
MVDRMSPQERVEGFIQEMPKVELHVHLEGAVLPETLLRLAEKHDVDLPAKDLDGIREFYTFRDFDHFVRVYMKINDCLVTPEDVGLITEELGNEAARQNIRYLEVTISPGTLTYIHGMTFDEILEQINAGADRAYRAHGVRMQYVLDVIRDMPPDVREAGARFAVEAMDRGVVALGLGGTEAKYPPEQFTDLFALARQAGLPSVPHAGETAGPDSIWNALKLLDAVRIGHGVRAIEDPALMEYLVEHQIPLEVSPTSNICIGVFDSWDEHPMRKLYDAGIPVSVNSDDPPMFNTTLTQEYRELVDRFGFSVTELESITLGALKHSFLPADDRRAMIDEFRSEFQRLREKFAIDFQ